MQKIIYRSEVRDFSGHLEPAVIDYIEEGQIKTFECFERFSIVAFDWYSIDDVGAEPSQMLLYIDGDDFFVICEDRAAFDEASRIFEKAETNESAMYRFFKHLFAEDTKHLEEIEDRISALDDAVINGRAKGVSEKIVAARYETLRLKKYYEQFDLLFEGLCDNENGLLSERYVRYFGHLQNRMLRLLSEVGTLREFIVQVRESYQAQIDIEENHLMKVFTLVTSIFLPLTLIAGWYGMNLKMPEFGWEYGYPIVIALCVTVCGIWAWVFYKKGWFK